MTPVSRLLVLAAALAVSLGACAHTPHQDPGNAGLLPFTGEADLARFEREMRAELKKRQAQLPPPPPPPAPALAPVVTTAAGAESITNVQHAGADEGGLVKVHGDHLVILRRGRLFTVSIRDGGLEPIAAVDAFGPDIDPQGAWFDEILVADGLVAVIGYSYERGGTEVGLFRLGDDGSLTHRGTYQLKSGDYYSSRNYASRLVGGRLVFYAPIPWDPDRGGVRGQLPAVREWGAADTAFRATAGPTRLFRAAGADGLERFHLHSVTICDPRGERLACSSTGVFGPRGRSFYVSPGAVYVWATETPRWDDRDSAPRSILYRIPLDGATPSGLRVAGAPADQMSFLESADRHLNVLVRSSGRGDAMWAGERGRGEVALLRLPLQALGDGSASAPASRYRPLPAPGDGAFQNRFVGDWVVYGSGGGWGRPTGGGGPAFATRWADASRVDSIPLPHAVDRIEQVGNGVLLIGSDGASLVFSAMRLASRVEPVSRYIRPAASQAETRTHGFFYRPDGPDLGLLALPVRGSREAGGAHLVRGAASMLFLRNEGLRLREAGELEAGTQSMEDNCRASCIDWYGNARPIFLRGRVLALMGYEIVEGVEAGGAVRELRRVSFAPVPGPGR